MPEPSSAKSTGRSRRQGKNPQSRLDISNYPHLTSLRRSASKDAEEIFKLPVVRELTIVPGIQPKLGAKPSKRLHLTNLESALAFLRGFVQTPCCLRCASDTSSGPYTECVTLDGYFQGACTNCAYNNRGGLCSFRPVTPGVRKGPDRAVKMSTMAQTQTQNGASSINHHHPATSSIPTSPVNGTGHAVDKHVDANPRNAYFANEKAYADAGISYEKFRQMTAEKDTAINCSTINSPTADSPSVKSPSVDSPSSSSPFIKIRTMEPKQAEKAEKAEKRDEFSAPAKRLLHLLDPDIPPPGPRSQMRRKLLADALLFPKRGETFYNVTSKLFREQNTIYCLHRLNNKVIKKATKLAGSKPTHVDANLAVSDAIAVSSEIAADGGGPQSPIRLTPMSLKNLGIAYHRSGLLVAKSTIAGQTYLEQWPVFSDDEPAYAVDEDTIVIPYDTVSANPLKGPAAASSPTTWNPPTGSKSSANKVPTPKSSAASSPTVWNPPTGPASSVNRVSSPKPATPITSVPGLPVEKAPHSETAQRKGSLPSGFGNQAKRTSTAGTQIPHPGPRTDRQPVSDATARLLGVADRQLVPVPEPEPALVPPPVPIQNEPESMVIDTNIHSDRPPERQFQRQPAQQPEGPTVQQPEQQQLQLQQGITKAPAAPNTELQVVESAKSDVQEPAKLTYQALLDKTRKMTALERTSELSYLHLRISVLYEVNAAEEMARRKGEESERQNEARLRLKRKHNSLEDGTPGSTPISKR